MRGGNLEKKNSIILYNITGERFLISTTNKYIVARYNSKNCCFSLPHGSINMSAHKAVWYRLSCSYTRADRTSRRHGPRMRKAPVAPSVGMATAPSVPASGRSILDDGGGGGGGGGGDDDDDDAQIWRDEWASQAGCGNSPPRISDRDSHAIARRICSPLGAPREFPS